MLTRHRSVNDVQALAGAILFVEQRRVAVYYIN